MNITGNPLNPQDLIELRLVVPAHLASGVQATILRYLDNAGDSNGTAGYIPPFASSSGPKNAWDLPDWSDTDEDRAAMQWLVEDLSEDQIAVLHAILNEPGTPTSLLLSAAGYPEGTAASPVFRAIGSRFRRVGRKPLWVGGDKTDRGQALGATSNQTAIRLFRDAVTKRASGTTPEITEEVWSQALDLVRLSDTDRKLIEAFRSFRDNAATAQMLADEMGYDAHGAANLAMGRLGKKLAEGLATVLPDFEPQQRSNGSTMWWHVVASGEIRDDGLFWWSLRPGLDAAAA